MSVERNTRVPYKQAYFSLNMERKSRKRKHPLGGGWWPDHSSKTSSEMGGDMIIALPVDDEDPVFIRTLPCAKKLSVIVLPDTKIPNNEMEMGSGWSTKGCPSDDASTGQYQPEPTLTRSTSPRPSGFCLSFKGVTSISLFRICPLLAEANTGI